MSLALDWREGEYPADGRRRDRAAVTEESRLRKRERERRRQRLTFLCFVSVAALISALFILIICLQVMVAQNDIRAREVERRIELERRQQEAMRLEIASLESQARIESLAVGQLGMVRAARTEYLETPAYEAAKRQGEERNLSEEGMVSEASQGAH